MDIFCYLGNSIEQFIYSTSTASCEKKFRKTVAVTINILQTNLAAVHYKESGLLEIIIKRKQTSNSEQRV